MSTSTETAALPAVSSMHWVWDAMEPVERSARMRELGRWTAWLVSTFHLGNKLNGCWYQHRDVVEVLTGLYLHWVQAYTPSPDGQPANHAEKTHWVATYYSLESRLATPKCAQEHAAGTDGEWDYSEIVMDIVLTARQAEPPHDGHPALHEMLQRQRQLLGA